MTAPASIPPDPSPTTTKPDRRADVEGKQSAVAELLRENDCEGLLVLQPENFAWLTSGAWPRNVLDPAEMPALFFTTENRYLVASNVDAQRFFDEEIDGLGFQLKEWPWNWGREQLIQYLSKGRQLACDEPLPECKRVADPLRYQRMGLTLYELAVFRELGLIVSHALEATCRTLSQGQSEQEVAGQLAHRTLHRGAEPVAVTVMTDGRGRRSRRSVPTSAPVSRNCILGLTARMNGFHATASRSMTFGQPDATLLKEHEAACKVTATYFAGSLVDALPAELLAAGRRVYLISGFEHEWRLGPQGWLTGRAPVELLLAPQTADPFRPGLALTWCATVGASASCDTYVITAKGPVLITQPASQWPLKRIRIQGANLIRPDVLVR